MEHYALAAQVFGAGLVFARIGAFVMLMPGIGEAPVPPRIRLAFAVVLSLTLYPVVRAGLPSQPSDLGGLFGDVALEIGIGLALGALLRMFMAALAVAGEVISLQTTLSFAQTTNPLQAQPSPSIGAFLALLGMTLVFSTDLHQMLIGAIVQSYHLFPTGRVEPVKALGAVAVETVSGIFALGVQLSAPVIVFSLAFNVATGMVARIMPQFQVFFAAAPLSLLLGISVFALSVGSIGLVWIDRFRAFLDRLV